MHRSLSFLLLGFTALVASASAAPPRPVYDETVLHGNLYVLGNRLQPPYRIVIENDSLWVNGFLTKPLPEPPLPEYPPEVLQRAENERRVMGMVYQRLVTVAAEKRVAAAENIKDDLPSDLAGLVDHVRFEDGVISVSWTNGSVPLRMSLDLDRKLASVGKSSEAWRSSLLETAKHLSTHLGLGGYAFLGRNGNTYSPNDDELGKDLADLLTITPGELKSKWHGRRLPYRLAREILEPYPLSSFPARNMKP